MALAAMPLHRRPRGGNYLDYTRQGRAVHANFSPALSRFPAALRAGLFVTQGDVGAHLRGGQSRA